MFLNNILLTPGPPFPDFLNTADCPGHVIAVTHTQTGAIERYVYSLYGVEMRGDESGNPFCYTGRRYDAETEQTAFWTDEYGVMVPLVVTVLALIYWRRAKAEGL